MNRECTWHRTTELTGALQISDWQNKQRLTRFIDITQLWRLNRRQRQKEGEQQAEVVVEAVADCRFVSWCDHGDDDGADYLITSHWSRSSPRWSKDTASTRFTQCTTSSFDEYFACRLHRFTDWMFYARLPASLVVVSSVTEYALTSSTADVFTIWYDGVNTGDTARKHTVEERERERAMWEESMKRRKRQISCKCVDRSATNSSEREAEKKS